MTEENNKEPEGKELLPAIADETLLMVADQAEKRVEAMTKIKRMALKLTNRHDWVDQDGKPYLQSSGAEKVARLFGISWRISEPTIENLEGGHYIVTYTGEFSLAGATIEAVGTRSSKDGFFKKYRYADGKRVGELPASEIDRGDVKKSAYSNLLGNGITRLLGIRNLTYEDLQECAGLRQQDISSIGYKKQGKVAPSQERKVEPDQDKSTRRPQVDETSHLPATTDQAQAIHSLLKKKGLEDELAKMEKVAVVLGLQKIPMTVTNLTKTQASTVIAALQKEIDSMESGGE